VNAYAGAETNFMSFGHNEYRFTAKEEEEYLIKIEKEKNEVRLGESFNKRGLIVLALIHRVITIFLLKQYTFDSPSRCCTITYIPIWGCTHDT